MRNTHIISTCITSLTAIIVLVTMNYVALSVDLPNTVIGKDGASMVLIPAGEFQMGSSDGQGDAKPVHTVYLDAFYMDKYEVTNAQYKKFVQATGYKEPEGKGFVAGSNGEWTPGFKPWSDSKFNGDNQPVVCVTWEDAKAYAEWAGKRLPTEAEWEKAARGGLVGKKYSWGDSLPSPRTVNWADETARGIIPGYLILSGYNDGFVYTSPVNSFPSNGYSLYDMDGNSLEWCSDWYGESYYYTSSPAHNPTGPAWGTERVNRGSSWYHSTDMPVSFRDHHSPTYASSGIGFRCVQDITPSVNVGMSTQQSINRGNTFYATISVAGASDLAGFQMDVAFNSAILMAVKVEEGTFLKTSGSTYWLGPQIDNAKGVITGIACGRTSKGGVAGGGTLASITFKAIGVGRSYIKPQNIILSNSVASIIPAFSSEGNVTVIDFPPWDVNKDGKVDILDIVIVGQHFAEKMTTMADPNPDVNSDGTINILDIVLVGQHFGEVYLPAAPSVDIWNVDPQYLPILTRLYSIIESNPNTDPNFIATQDLLRKLISNTKVSRTEVFQNYPNPFNPETWIPYKLADASNVTIRIYNSAGQLIRILDMGYIEAGSYIAKDAAAYWDGRTDTGERVSSGVYFYNIHAGDYTATKKMVITQ